MYLHEKAYYMSKFMKSQLTKTLPAFLVVATPLVALSQDEEGISGLIDSLTQIVNQLIPLAASIALLGFFWGLARYIFKAGDEDAKAEGKRIMIGGIIALFLIAAVGGIIQFIGTALGVPTEGGTITPPTINGGAGGG